MFYLCTLCGKEFSTQTKLQEHESNVHDDTKNCCPTCQKEIIGKKKFRNHLAFSNGQYRSLGVVGHFHSDMVLRF